MKYCTVCQAKYEDSVSFCPVDGEVLEDDPSSIVDTVLDGQYQVEAMLGKGGMGAVYSARHILLGDRVAIKILPPEVRNNAEWLRRFRREGQAARRFRHPNAVTVYDLRTAGDGTIYMVMEYVEGHTLGEEIKRRGRFTPAEAFEILEPIMSVLNTAHAMGVVHRDLKPDNIMIGKTGDGEPVVKLLDLGIAKMREIAGGDSGGSTALTMAGQVLGTPHYMSPEQWGELPRDGDSEIDGRADLYSLGLVCYEMIVGKRPYSGLTLHELRREHISVMPPPLSDIAPDVPPAFSDAIARATAKDRGERQATAGQFAAELRAAASTTAPTMISARTLPDLPRVGESAAHTSEVGQASETNSDVNAPTIITVDSPATAPGIPPPAPHQRNAVSFAPAIGPMDMSSSVTIPQVRPPLQPPSLQPQVAERSKRRGTLILAGAGGLVLLLLIVGVGGFLAVKWITAKNGSEAVVEKKDSAAAVATGAKDVAHYWLELMPETPEALLGDSSRVAGMVPLPSGQSFKFHFVFSEDGYLYLVGPGNQNQLTAFLTAKPPALSGLTSNQVSKEADFSFPDGIERWLKLDTKPGTEDYTVIFSLTPLDSPEFLGAQATGSPLTESEQQEFTGFLTKYKTSDPITEINDKNGAQPFVVVKVPQSETSGSPVVFGIRIQHK